MLNRLMDEMEYESEGDDLVGTVASYALWFLDFALFCGLTIDNHRTLTFGIGLLSFILLVFSFKKMEGSTELFRDDSLITPLFIAKEYTRKSLSKELKKSCNNGPTLTNILCCTHDFNKSLRGKIQ